MGPGGQLSPEEVWLFILQNCQVFLLLPLPATTLPDAVPRVLPWWVDRGDHWVYAAPPDNVRIGERIVTLSSVVTSKPANGGHRKSGQWGWPGTVLFYPFEPVPGKPVLVRQLRGPHLRT